MSRTFAQLGVPDSIVRSLSRQGITRPFDIQTATLADALAGERQHGQERLLRKRPGFRRALDFDQPLLSRHHDVHVDFCRGVFLIA